MTTLIDILRIRYAMPDMVIPPCLICGGSPSFYMSNAPKIFADDPVDSDAFTLCVEHEVLTHAFKNIEIDTASMRKALAIEAIDAAMAAKDQS